MRKIAAFFFLVLLCGDTAWGQINPEEAVRITRDLEEAKLFYQLIEQIEQKDCIDISVKAPCDSEWVTCVDDAWVVRYFIKDECALAHEQLSVTWVVGTEDGNIISRYPEKDYFEDPRFCLEDFDCFDVQTAGCLNFLHARLEAGPDARPGCQCRAQSCVPKSE